MVVVGVGTVMVVGVGVGWEQRKSTKLVHLLGFDPHSTDIIACAPWHPLAR